MQRSFIDTGRTIHYFILLEHLDRSRGNQSLPRASRWDHANCPQAWLV